MGLRTLSVEDPSGHNGFSGCGPSLLEDGVGPVDCRDLLCYRDVSYVWDNHSGYLNL